MFIDSLRMYIVGKQAVKYHTSWPLGEILCEMEIFWSVTPEWLRKTKLLKHHRPGHEWFKHT